MHHRLRLPHGEAWSGPTNDELSDFLFDISDKQRKRLKRIADALIEQGETLHQRHEGRNFPGPLVAALNANLSLLFVEVHLAESPTFRPAPRARKNFSSALAPT